MKVGNKNIKVSFIIINYNTDELTIQAVKSIELYVKDINYEIIVIDNNSKETKLLYELSTFENTFFYQLDENIGFGKANNFGYSKAKGEFIFLLNSDAYLIDENTIPVLIDFLQKNENVAVVGCNLINEKGQPNICHGRFLSIERILYNYGLKKVTKEYFNEYLATASHCSFKNPTPVDHLTGAAIMIKRTVIEQFGLFNPKYFMYLEDMDLCYRYKMHGYMSVLIPHVKIVHFGGQSNLNNKELNKRIKKEIDYSRYLFLQNITSKPVALSLFVMGKIINFYKRVKRKLKTIFYAT